MIEKSDDFNNVMEILNSNNVTSLPPWLFLMIFFMILVIQHFLFVGLFVYLLDALTTLS